MRWVLGVVLGWAVSAWPAVAQPQADRPTWAEFLGPMRNGVSTEKGLYLDWGEVPPKQLWKRAVGGGYSSVVVDGPTLYLMVSRNDRDGLLALNAADGSEKYFVDLAPVYIDRQRQGPGPRATPTLRDGKLYCQLPRGELFCLAAADGKRLWSKDIFTEAGSTNPIKEFYYWGVSGSPLVEDGQVIVQPGGNQNNSVIALDAATGRLIWKGGNGPISYGSPIAIDAAGRRQIVATTGTALIGLDPKTGQQLWSYAIGNAMFNTNCVNPVHIGDGKIFYSSAYGAGTALVQIVNAGKGQLQVKELWRNKLLQNLFVTSIVHEGHIYGSHGDIGAVMFKCLDLATGQEKWTDRRIGRCMMLAVEGHLLILSERGSLRSLRMNPQKSDTRGLMPNVLAGRCWAAPALCDGRLYIRDESDLVCLDLRK
jgi:outer membrane protein assembly factor BamB